MVKVEIDEVYRKPTNLFELNIASHGNIYRIPRDYNGDFNRSLTVYDKTTVGLVSCINFGQTWEETECDLKLLKIFISKQFSLSLREKGYETSKTSKKFERSYIAYSPEKEIHTPDKDIYEIFDGFEYRVLVVDQVFYLCINPHLKIKNKCSVKMFLEKGLSPSMLESLRADYYNNQNRIGSCNIITAEPKKSRIRDFDSGRDLEVVSDSIFIIPKPEILNKIIGSLNRVSRIIEIQRKYSFLKQRDAAKDRLSKTLEIASDMADHVFPLTFGDFVVEFLPKAVSVRF